MESPAKPNHRTGVSAALAAAPLTTLLSEVLVAFTVEFDNEFERQMPHRTTIHGAKVGARDGPWLVSLAMWSNCMQFVGDDGVTVGELERLARTTTNLHGMQRWGYIVVEPEPSGGRQKPRRADYVIRATPKGRQAREVWRPLCEAIEKRWQARFGRGEIDQLRESLSALISRIDIELPDCLPILGYGLFSRGPDDKRRPESGRDRDCRLPLPALLSRVLLAFAIEFERESELSLAIGANVVRVLDETGVRVQDLPFLTGVSKEAIRMALGILMKKRLAVIEPDPKGGRAKVARLTGKGREAQEVYRRLLVTIEESWTARFGEDTIGLLRGLLQRLAGEGAVQTSPLFVGLEPYPDGWRASVSRPATLPHYPMVLHRGGFPDGS